MNYYTLTKRGRAWIEGEAPDPKRYRETLAALAEMVDENDVPRLPEQVAHIVNISTEQSQARLNSLIAEGYVMHQRLPQPSDRGEVARPRIRPIEEDALAEAKAEASRKRYADSLKGRAAHNRYEDSVKGKAKNTKYWSDPDKGRLVQKKYRLRRRLKEMQDHLKKHPELKSLIQPDIDKTRKRLVELEEVNNGTTH